jgi:hypothetical protein
MTIKFPLNEVLRAKLIVQSWKWNPYSIDQTQYTELSINNSQQFITYEY